VVDISTFSWLYMPFILDAAGAVLDTLFRPAWEHWIWYREVLHGAMDRIGITLASILVEASLSLHLTAQRQEENLGLCPLAAAFATEEAWGLVWVPSRCARPCWACPW
jgi:hypothetical protein